jgi:diguanylate cyclase (GGDEF)-like protein
MIYSESGIRLFVIKSGSLLGIVAASVFGVLNLSINNITAGIVDLCFSGLLAFIFLLVLFKKISLGKSSLLIFAAGSLMFSFLLCNGGYKNFGIAWLVVGPVICFLQNEKKKGLIYYLLFFAIITAVYIVSKIAVFALPYSDTVVLSIFTVMAFEGLFLYFYKKTRENSHKELNDGVCAILDRTESLETINKRLEYLSTFDTLTLTYNRRRILELLNMELMRKLRYKGFFSLLLIDLDNFKSLNDTYGHLFGDYVLQKFSDIIIKDILRKIDSVGRYGGEEFLVILPSTNLEGAIKVAERIRSAVSSTVFIHEDSGKEINVTVSIGVSTSDSGDTHTELIQKADYALYGAKGSGKNKVQTYMEKYA